MSNIEATRILAAAHVSCLAAPTSVSQRSWGVRSASMTPAPMDGGGEERLSRARARGRLRFPRLDEARIAAEAAYAAAPIVHLAAMAACGRESWRPFALSMGLDAFR